MPTNLKRLKLKLDIVEKPENRVHKLTDSNGVHCHALCMTHNFILWVIQLKPDNIIRSAIIYARVLEPFIFRAGGELARAFTQIIR